MSSGLEVTLYRTPYGTVQIYWDEEIGRDISWREIEKEAEEAVAHGMQPTSPIALTQTAFTALKNKWADFVREQREEEERARKAAKTLSEYVAVMMEGDGSVNARDLEEWARERGVWE